MFRVSFKQLVILALLALIFMDTAMAQWQKVGPQDFKSPNSQHGCAICYMDGVTWAGASSLYQSDDLGKNWQLCKTFPLPSTDILGIYFFDRLNGFVLAEYLTFMTTDGGASWKKLDCPANRWGSFGSTADTFYVTPIGEFDMLVKGEVKKQLVDEIYLAPLVDRNGAIYYLRNYNVQFSHDFGNSWGQGNTVDRDCNAIAVDSCDQNTIYLVNEEIFTPDDGKAGIYVSRDAGNTWTLKNPHDPNYYTGDLAESKYAVYTQTQDGILRSTDKGETWASIGGPTGPPDNLSLCVAADTVLLAIDSFGNMWRTSNEGGASLVGPMPLTLSATDLSLADTIGEGIWLPISVQHDSTVTSVSFHMTYDTTLLALEGFLGQDGSLLSKIAANIGSATYSFHLDPKHHFDTLYAEFSWYPTTDSSTIVSFDAIEPTLAPTACANVFSNNTAQARIHGHIRCETPIISSFMRTNEPPYLSVQPNPATTIISISTNYNASQLTLCDALGRVIRRFESVPDRVPVGDLPSGLYYVDLNGGPIHITKPLIIAH